MPRARGVGNVVSVFRSFGVSEFRWSTGLTGRVNPVDPDYSSRSDSSGCSCPLLLATTPDFPTQRPSENAEAGRREAGMKGRRGSSPGRIDVAENVSFSSNLAAIPTRPGDPPKFSRISLRLPRNAQPSPEVTNRGYMDPITKPEAGMKGRRGSSPGRIDVAENVSFSSNLAAIPTRPGDPPKFSRISLRLPRNAQPSPEVTDRGCGIHPRRRGVVMCGARR